MSAKKTVTAMTREEMRKEIKSLRQDLDEAERSRDLFEKRRGKEYRLKYLSFVNSIPDPVFVFDAITYKFLHCNDMALINYGYSKEELITMTPFDLHRDEDFEEVRKEIDKKTTGRSKTRTHLTKDRRERIVEVTTTDIYHDGNPAWMIIAHDITERTRMQEELKQYRGKLEDMVNERTIEVLLTNKKLREEIQERKKAEQAIMESEKKFRDMIEKSLDGILLVDETGTVIEWNFGQERIYGAKRAMVMGRKIWDVQLMFEPKNARDEKNSKKIKKIWDSFFRDGTNPFRNDLHVSRIERPDGGQRDIQQLYFTIDTDKGAMMACTTRDITEKVEMEKQLIQTQKMEAMGTLAGGIAHDFNNILGGIVGYTDLALRRSESNSPIKRYMEQVLTASKRATDLVKQILTFSRRNGKKENEPVKFSIIVKEALKLLRSSLPTDIEIVTKLKAPDSYVLADPTHLHQVMMNLCTNAAHAMQDNGGVLEVRLTDEMIKDSTYKGLKPGLHVLLTVSDTGSGIKPDMLDKIFDPFFTTKKEGEGTGMGLAVVHGIVQNCGGNITVYSKENEGTVFSVRLPVTVDVIHMEEDDDKNIPGGNEHILLVEDDNYLAEVERNLLQELGYKVTVMTSSVEALELYQRLEDQFDLIVTDYVMPKMRGDQLIRKIRYISPDIPVIICTGYSGYEKVLTPQKIKNLNVGEVVMKPIDLGLIARALRRLLDKA